MTENTKNESKVSDEHKHLYHYTTFEGAKGILESQTLWATHYKFLNVPHGSYSCLL